MVQFYMARSYFRLNNKTGVGLEAFLKQLLLLHLRKVKSRLMIVIV